jgi:hypothetical protein
MIYEGVPFMPLARRDRMLAEAKQARAKQVGRGSAGARTAECQGGAGCGARGTSSCGG